MGDYNDILHHYEKVGGVSHVGWLINGFRQAVEDSHLTNLVIHGGRFTWFQDRQGVGCIKEKLDRALINPRWHDLFPDAVVLNVGITS